jgi:superfamily II DNA or RNA helicase
MNLQPRDYQDEARTKILATRGERPWYNGNGETYRSCVLNIPTSSGKTVVAGMVCESVSARGRFLYLADRDELCTQPQRKFYKLLGFAAAVEKAEQKASQMSQGSTSFVMAAMSSFVARFSPFLPV